MCEVNTGCFVSVFICLDARLWRLAVSLARCANTAQELEFLRVLLRLMLSHRLKLTHAFIINPMVLRMFLSLWSRLNTQPKTK